MADSNHHHHHHHHHHQCSVLGAAKRLCPILMISWFRVFWKKGLTFEKPFSHIRPRNCIQLTVWLTECLGFPILLQRNIFVARFQCNEYQQYANWLIVTTRALKCGRLTVDVELRWMTQGDPLCEHSNGCFCFGPGLTFVRPPLLTIVVTICGVQYYLVLLPFWALCRKRMHSWHRDDDDDLLYDAIVITL